ncbi:A-kinase anchor protein 17A like protein [Argiope bruennichi]|uniref:A-kinase anchor protein 17A like protein n=1 Tax=Argiope bruennichi TaxID=94029 RepID=A0A8T0E2I3_ARGBR|nr:A-kinase anchor protein 17A like protein [Argiope bruennichi]
MNVSEASNFESSLGLYLKPVSRIKINVQLPKLSVPGQSISTWQVMEKLKETIRPDTFLYLKSLKITATVIKFEGELETKSSSERALARLRAVGSLKLNGFSERLQIRAAHATSIGPTRHDWESFFRDAKGVNEMRPGERPDTIHVEELPVCWFTENGKFTNPNEKLLRKAFGTFGKIRRIEIPPKTTPSSSMFGKTSSLHNDLLFEAYIQYEEYVEFVIAMESLRGKKLLYKGPDGKVYSADIKVDFDRTNYLSERCIKQRAVEAKKASLSEDIKVAAKEVEQLEISQKSKVKVLDKNSTTVLETKIYPPPFINQEEAQTEAQLLLKELLHRAEISEQCKEKQLKLPSTNLQSEDKSSKSFSTKDPTTSKMLKKMINKRNHIV